MRHIDLSQLGLLHKASGIYQNKLNNYIKKPPGNDLFSHTLANAISSALRRFTTVFGMGTGGATSLESPRDFVIGDKV